MPSHSKSFDENSGKNVADLVDLSSKENRLAPAGTPLPSDSTSQHDRAETEGKEEKEETNQEEKERRTV